MRPVRRRSAFTNDSIDENYNFSCRASSDLQKSNKRIHILKGLTSPTYLAFMAGVDKSFDPILKAFDLANDVITVRQIIFIICVLCIYEMS